MPERAAELVIITGMTGAGRSTAAKELEDLGYFVVDNLPPTLVPDVVRMVDAERGSHQPIAVVVDVRSGTFFEALASQRYEGSTGRPTTVVFLDATNDTLVRRQDAVRRPHPLQGDDGRLLDGLERERVALHTIRGQADLVIDTTGLNVHQLTDRIATHFGSREARKLKITVISFGFKYGIPIDADYVADMRFLPNPHWVPELRPRTGQDIEVAGYVRSQPGAQPFLDGFLPLLKLVAGGYLTEGKRFMTVAVGCTGGKHRSVAMSEEIARRLTAAGQDVRTIHRDLGRE